MLTDSLVRQRRVLQMTAQWREAEVQLQVAGVVMASREGPVAVSTPVLAVQLQRHLQGQGGIFRLN